MNNELSIPKPIADFVKAVNEHNTDAFLAVFAERAVIMDEGHEYHGKAAIKKWNDEKNIGAEITLDPVDVFESENKIILTAKVDGNFDKTGLPDPFLMDLHFIFDGNKIASLSYHLAGK